MIYASSKTMNLFHRARSVGASFAKIQATKRVVWEATSIPQIAEARKLFDALREEGMTAFRVGTDGKQSSEEMKEFDPLAEEVIFVQMKHVVGG
jgi:hypothetical protein